MKSMAMKRREFLNSAFLSTLAAASGCSRTDGEARGGGLGATGYSLVCEGDYIQQHKAYWK